MPPAFRYALYFCPPDPWLSWGRSWLGRCEIKNSVVAQIEPRVAAWTSAPRHYGLHGTLKAPFRLAQGKSVSELDEATSELAQRITPFVIRLQRQILGDFMVWMIADNDTIGKKHMRALADIGIAELDTFRAPTTSEDLARRNPQELSDSHRNMLECWGYPYAFDTFIFHMTLTNKLPKAQLLEAERLFEQLVGNADSGSMPVTTISIYVQASAGFDFIAARHYGFDGSRVDAAGADYLW